METVQTITAHVQIQLSDDGRKAALLAGRDARAVQTLTGEVPAELLEHGSVDDEGRAVFDARQDASRFASYWFPAPPADAEDAIRTWLAAVEAERAKAAAEFAGRKRRFLSGEADPYFTPVETADPEIRAEKLRREVDRWLDIPNLGRRYPSDAPANPPRGSETDPAVAAVFQRRLAAYEAEREEAKRAAAEKAAAAERRAAEQRAWTLGFLAEHGRPDQRERFEAGLLPAAELEDQLRYVYLGSLIERFGEFQRVDPADVCEECWDGARAGTYERDIFTFRTEPVAGLTGAQWTALQEIRAALPEGATAEPRERIGQCDAREHTEEGHGLVQREDVLVKLATGAGVELRVSLALPE